MFAFRNHDKEIAHSSRDFFSVSFVPDLQIAERDRSFDMSFVITASFAKRLRDAARLEPLRVGEIRRVEGLGEMYLVLARTAVDDTAYVKLLSVSIDGVSHALCRRVPKQFL